MSEAVIEFQDISIQYQNQECPAAEHISFLVPRHSILVIVGESGSGKSTLLRSVIRLLPDGGQITGGRILFDGIDLAAADVRQVRKLCGSRISTIFQDAGLYLDSRRTIGYQYVEGIRCHKKVSRGEAKQMARAMLEKLCLPSPEHIMASYPFELSGGMKQRTAIAMAMTMAPELLLADEPTSALDVTIQAQVVRQMKELREQLGTSIILVTHNMGLASYLADHIAVMRKGKLMEWGTRDQVIYQPRSSYTRTLLDAAPELKL
ncbi:MAG: ABC transporter ATP-binding protein [Lachnospiraceae bacterium]|nr:ABC transporter ATP-binding protein [Lachnospiraceae bacterium]